MLEKILRGSIATSDILNNNFDYLDERITDTVSKLYTNNSSFDSKIATVNTNLSSQVDKLRPIGQPIIRLDNTLFDDEVRLEGEIVSRINYASLFSIYGITYGAGDGATTFKLPDFRNRAIWGMGDGKWGYLEAGLPNITGRFEGNGDDGTAHKTGCFYQGNAMSGGNGGTGGAYIHFNASRSSAIYGKSTTVQPPAIKVRVVTRFK